MTLKLTTGFCHGLRLQDPCSSTRPTAGRVRSAVWNALQERVAGARVLDLFSGSGAVGIEALSRGAASVTFVEKDKEALKALQQNLLEVKRRADKQKLKMHADCQPLPALKAIKTFSDDEFDIIWMDPPFSELRSLLPPLREDLFRVLGDRGVLVAESDAGSLDFMAQLFAADGQPWHLIKQKVYGNIGVSFFETRRIRGEEDSK